MAKNIKLPEATDSTPPATLANGTNGANGSHGTNGTTTVSPTIAPITSPVISSAPQEAPALDEHNPIGATPYDPPADRHASAYAVALGQLDRVADFMQLDDDIRVYLRTCQRELIVHFPVKMDDGTVQMFTGYRVHHKHPRPRRRAASATACTSIWTKCARWRCG